MTLEQLQRQQIDAMIKDLLRRSINKDYWNCVYGPNPAEAEWGRMAADVIEQLNNRAIFKNRNFRDCIEGLPDRVFSKEMVQVNHLRSANV